MPLPLGRRRRAVPSQRELALGFVGALFEHRVAGDRQHRCVQIGFRRALGVTVAVAANDGILRVGENAPQSGYVLRGAPLRSKATGHSRLFAPEVGVSDSRW